MRAGRSQLTKKDLYAGVDRFTQVGGSALTDMHVYMLHVLLSLRVGWLMQPGSALDKSSTPVGSYCMAQVTPPPVHGTVGQDCTVCASAW